MKRFIFSILFAASLLGAPAFARQSLHVSTNESAALGSRSGLTDKGWTPNWVSGVLFWVNGESGVTLNSTTVSAWANQTGVSRTASQGTGGNQPTFHSTGGGANGTLSYLSTSGATATAGLATATSWTNTQPCEVFVESSWTLPGGFKYLIDGSGGGNTLAILSNNSAVKIAIDSGTLLSSGTITVPGWSIYDALFSGNASTLTVGGVSFIPAGAAGSTAATGFTLFNNQSLTAAANAGIAEVVIATSPTALDRTLILAYMRNRSGNL